MISAQQGLHQGCRAPLREPTEREPAGAGGCPPFSSTLSPGAERLLPGITKAPGTLGAPVATATVALAASSCLHLSFPPTPQNFVILF